MSGNEKIMLKIDNAVKTFFKGLPQEHTVLNNLSLELKEGDFVSVVGSNGAGKSTLFNAICGTFFLDGGAVLLDGKDITYQPDFRRAKWIGRVFQDPMKGTAPNLTIEENLALAYSRIKKHALAPAISSKEIKIFRERLSTMEMGLEDRMKTKVGLLSGGQRQVVTLMMCTLNTPKLLLLDEHTAALDPQTSEKIMEITNRIVKENNLTTMMITHNLNAALTTGNRTIMMDEGNIILDIHEEERKGMSLEDLLNMYSQKSNRVFDNDRILLQKK